MPNHRAKSSRQNAKPITRFANCEGNGMSGGMNRNIAIRYPWQNRKGAFSPLKALALALVLAPALWIGIRFATGTIGAKPVDLALHETGRWAIRFLLLTLAVTPYRLITGDNRVIAVRRILGVAALGFTLAHVLLYVLQQRYDLVVVALEIVKRFYLTIGFVAFAMMLALGLTSFDSAIRRLGAARWNALHRLIYALTVLGILHGYIQSKIDVSERVIETGIFLALMGVRLMRGRIAFTPLALAALGLIAGVLALGLEYLWYATATGVPAARVFAANFMWDLAPRPGLSAFLICLLLPLLALLPQARASRAAPRRATNPAMNAKRSG